MYDKAIFTVQSANKPDAISSSLNGSLVSGMITVGDLLRVTASGQTAKLTRLVIEGKEVVTAHTCKTLTLELSPPLNASTCDVLTLADQPLEMSDQFEATLSWEHSGKGLSGRTYGFELANQSARATLTSIKYRINPLTNAHEPSKQLLLNETAVVNLALSKPVAFTSHLDSPTLGHFTLFEKLTNTKIATGTIRHNLRRAQNVHRQALSIARMDREQLNGHRGKVIWFTGLSGSGKSTIANALEQELHAQGNRTYILDGDNVRQGLNKDLGFTDADRVENIRRVAETAKLMLDAGLIVMTAFISPFRTERQMARELIGEENFVEIFVDTPLEICEQRDPKGLYKKARNGQLPNMTGIHSPYEAPEHPDFIVSHAKTNLQGTVILIREFLGL